MIPVEGFDLPTMGLRAFTKTMAFSGLHPWWFVLILASGEASCCFDQTSEPQDHS